MEVDGSNAVPYTGVPCPGVPGAWCVGKTNTLTYKKVVFNVADAMFGNGISGADFYIDSMGDGNEWIHMVDVQAPRDQRGVQTLAPYSGHDRHPGGAPVGPGPASAARDARRAVRRMRDPGTRSL